MLEQFLLDRVADEPNPEPTEPIPWPEEHAPTPVSAEASAQGPEASPELILTTGTDDGVGAITSSGTSSCREPEVQLHATIHGCPVRAAACRVALVGRPADMSADI